MTEKYKQFMLESNRIEGEDRVNPDDMEAIIYALHTGIKTLTDICVIHGLLGKYLNVDWTGKFRTVNVQVGSEACPRHFMVVELMERYIEKFSLMDSWTAHNEFEKIHPFRDLNGRVGRLIWLSKAVDEGYDFQIPFLQMYYYQTLKEYKKK